MKLVVDSNVLFTFFWKQSVFNTISIKQNLILFAPEFSLEEINKYKEEIIRKTKITPAEFENLKKELALRITFIPLEEYSPFLKKAEKLINTTPENIRNEILGDIDFIALSLKLQHPLWTNDKLLKKISIDIFSTQEIIKLWEEE